MAFGQAAVCQLKEDSDIKGMLLFTNITCSAGGLFCFISSIPEKEMRAFPSIPKGWGWGGGGGKGRGTLLYKLYRNVRLQGYRF